MRYAVVIEKAGDNYSAMCLRPEAGRFGLGLRNRFRMK
jgi:hypothetical protein